jgi:hypothetical protein
LQLDLHSFQKDKSHGPDGWLMDFFLGFYDLIEGDFLRVVEESRSSRKVHNYFNIIFSALILKKENPSLFDDFKLISLYNCIYKIIAKIISLRASFESISNEHFGFLHCRKIHDAIGMAQERMHTMKTKKLLAMVLRLDLSKSHDWEN